MMNPSATASFEQQYEALRSGCATFELVDWSSVTLTGADRQTFLNSFCTNDVKRLEPGEHCEAFFTNIKGKILAHGLVVCRDNELLLIGAPGQASRLMEHLDRYVIREDVQLRDTTSERAFVLVAGGASARERCTDFQLVGSAAVHPQYVSWNLVGSDFARVLEISRLEVPFYLEALAGRGIVVAGHQAFSTARIEAGMPLFGVDFSDQNFPQEIGRDKEAISFTKGCYLGQETVARIDALGHVNQRLAGVQFFDTTVPDVGTELLHAGAKVGRVTSAAFSLQLHAPLALAMIRRDANTPGSRLESPVGECEVVELPVVNAA